MKPQGFPRWLRLRQRREFLRVQRRGEKHHTRHFLVFVARRSPSLAPTRGRTNESKEAVKTLVSASRTSEVTSNSAADALPPTRLGVTVTRKVGRAHQRNRIKRLVREVFRQERGLLVPGYDMVWVAKRNAVESTLQQVQSDFVALARRLRRRAERDVAPTPASDPLQPSKRGSS